jgi:PKD repeat protein
MKTKKHFIGLFILMITSVLNAQIATVEHLIAEDIGGATSIGAGDLDNDGDIDFAVTASDNGIFSWFENNGAMEFSQHNIGTGFLGGSTVSLRDIDNDNDSDLVACSKTNDKIVLYKNNGYNDFIEQVITDTLNGASYVYMFDMNMDGNMDILATACGGNKVMWYENDGNENFTAHIIKDNWNEPTNAFPVDMDFDGDIDVVACGKTGQILWFENNGNMGYIEDTVVVNWGDPSSVFASDIDDDGDIDIAATSCGNANEVAWYENNGGFDFTRHIIRDNYSGARSVIVSDFDDDNDKDIIAVGWSASIASIFMNDDSENFTEYIFCNTAYDLLKLVVIDMDLDNDPDIIGSCFGNHELRWWESLSTFLFADFSASTLSGHAPLTVNFQDISNSKPAVTSWLWDLNGDNIMDDNLQNPQYSYTTAGSYNVHLFVENALYQDDTLKNDYIRIFDGESAMEFNGITGSVFIESDSAISPVENISIETWINPYSFGRNGEGRIVDKDYLKIFVYAEGPQSETDSCIVVNIRHTDNTISKFSTPGHSIQLNAWQHIALTYSGSNNQAHVYIDGADQVLDYITYPSGNLANHAVKDIRLGNNSSGIRTFDGIIDEVRYWNTARTALEIASNMEHCVDPASAGLTGYWQMNEGNGDTLANLTNNNYKGIISAARWQQGMNLLPVSISETTQNITETTFSFAPNPADSHTDFIINLNGDAKISLEIFNETGKKVFTVINEKEIEKGRFHYPFNTSRLNNGVYFGLLNINNAKILTKKLIIIR